MPPTYVLKQELSCSACQVNGFLPVRDERTCPRCGGPLMVANREFPQTFDSAWETTDLASYHETVRRRRQLSVPAQLTLAEIIAIPGGF